MLTVQSWNKANVPNSYSLKEICLAPGRHGGGFSDSKGGRNVDS